MSLVDCPECTHDVSEYADACPHCGYPFEENNAETGASVVLTDIEIGFNSWALILLKAGIAAVPVVIVSSLLYFVLSAMIVGGLFGG